jgi:hypothetical protein
VGGRSGVLARGIAGTETGVEAGAEAGRVAGAGGKTCEAGVPLTPIEQPFHSEHKTVLERVCRLLSTTNKRPGKLPMFGVGSSPSRTVCGVTNYVFSLHFTPDSLTIFR